MDTFTSKTANNPARVMLWTVPRTLATVLCKCLSFVPGAQIFYEPFLTAWEIGPECSVVSSGESAVNEKFYSQIERMVPTLDIQYPDTNWFDSHVCTYEWVKNNLESEFDSDVEMVLCKDMVYAMTGHYDKIPQGYQHVFLIRNPLKQMPSWKQMTLNAKDCSAKVVGESIEMQPEKFSLSFDTKYADMIKLYTYLTTNLPDTPIVIDADDLQNHTASILRQFLEAIGVPYRDSFLTWNQSDEFSKQWVLPKIAGYGNLINGENGWYHNAFRSTCIRQANGAPELESLPQDLADMVKSAMPVYEELYQLRMKP